MIAGLFYSIYGFLLDPNVLAAVLHKEKYEMYQINVLICWISPLNQAVYGKHNLGYDPLLPKLWQSCVFFSYSGSNTGYSGASQNEEISV